MSLEILATAAADKKHKREVCRYWLQGKCIKGLGCEFLHAIDYEKMPVCRLGDLCQDSECTFKHPIVDQGRSVCANYQIGFCSFGTRCPHKHIQFGPGDLPTISPYWLQEYAALPENRPKQKYFRHKPCEYFRANGWCPYFDMCNFVH